MLDLQNQQSSTSMSSNYIKSCSAQGSLLKREYASKCSRMTVNFSRVLYGVQRYRVMKGTPLTSLHAYFPNFDILCTTQKFKTASYVLTVCMNTNTPITLLNCMISDSEFRTMSHNYL